MSKERPILFSAPMVRALLDGSKTQTRRVLRDQVAPPALMQMAGPGYAEIINEHGVQISGWPCPYGQPGDRLWVRETVADIGARLTYRAHTDDGAHCMVKHWTPSIHMPRWASRILLEVVSVRVERLNDISDPDALAEGCSTKNMRNGDCLASVYARLWEQINGAGSWDANPWVWVVEFKRMAP